MAGPVADNHPGDHTDATAVAGAATDTHTSGQITSEALTTAAAAEYLLTLTNPKVNADSVVLVSVFSGTNTTIGIAVHEVTPGAGSVTIRVCNTHASAAWNGTIVISYTVL